MDPHREIVEKHTKSGDNRGGKRIGDSTEKLKKEW